MQNVKFSKSNLIVCPHCWAKGEKQILGELTPEGNVEIMRFHQNVTRIISKEFIIQCGKCGNSVYIRSGKIDVKK